MEQLKVVKKFCKDCKKYNRKTKMCDGIKYIPRKGTCTDYELRGK
jgi:hypothetical protein